MTHLITNNQGANFGFIASDLPNIISIINKQPEVEQVILFGSRAKGLQKNGSDVDLAIKGAGINYSVIRKISYELNEESLMPYHFDVLNFHTITNPNLVDHITRVGICIYDKNA